MSRPLFVLTVALLHSACDSGPTAPVGPSRPTTPTPPTPTSGGTTAAAPPASIELGHPATAEEIRRGRQIFGAACGRCHSPEGGAPSVIGIRITPQRLLASLHAGDDEGRRLMPAINPGDMTDADLPLLVAYLRSENTVE